MSDDSKYVLLEMHVHLKLYNLLVVWTMEYVIFIILKYNIMINYSNN